MKLNIAMVVAVSQLVSASPSNMLEERKAPRGCKNNDCLRAINGNQKGLPRIASRITDYNVSLSTSDTSNTVSAHSLSFECC